MPWNTIIKWAGGIVGGLVLAWIFYAGLIRPTTKPNPTTKQEAQTIYNENYYVTPRPIFGCTSTKLYRLPQNITGEK